MIEIGSQLLHLPTVCQPQSRCLTRPDPRLRWIEKVLSKHRTDGESSEVILANDS